MSVSQGLGRGPAGRQPAAAAPRYCPPLILLVLLGTVSMLLQIIQQNPIPSLAPQTAVRAYQDMSLAEILHRACKQSTRPLLADDPEGRHWGDVVRFRPPARGGIKVYDVEPLVWLFGCDSPDEVRDILGDMGFVLLDPEARMPCSKTGPEADWWHNVTEGAIFANQKFTICTTDFEQFRAGEYMNWEVDSTRICMHWASEIVSIELHAFDSPEKLGYATWRIVPKKSSGPLF